jgi:hypothetical protein
MLWHTTFHEGFSNIFYLISQSTDSSPSSKAHLGLFGGGGKVSEQEFWRSIGVPENNAEDKDSIGILAGPQLTPPGKNSHLANDGQQKQE